MFHIYHNDSTPTTREWTLDSASTSQVCQNKEYFVDLRPPIRKSEIKMGSTPHKVDGLGKITFIIKNGPKIESIILENVLYVPSINRILINMVRIDSAGMHAKLDKGFHIISPRWKCLWSAHRRNNFYVIKGLPVSFSVCNQSRRKTFKVENKN